MITPLRTRLFLVTLGGVLGGLAMAAPAAAQEEADPTGAPTVAPTVAPTSPPAGDDQAGAAGAGAGCAVTGYVVDSDQDLGELRRALRSETVHSLNGLPLDRSDTWVLPDGGRPVIVVDSVEPLPGGETAVVIGGRSIPATSEQADIPTNRYVSNVTLPHLGSTVRTLGLEVDSGDCGAALVLSMDRSLLTTLVGVAGVVLTSLFGLLTVLVARLRKGGWLRRFLFAAPLGVVAGVGQAVVLYEAGVISPFDAFPWWLPVAGLALAALLPLTRWGRRRAGAPAGAGSWSPAWSPAWSPSGSASGSPAGSASGETTVWLPPVHVPLAGYQPVGGFTRTAVGEVHRAVTTDGQQRALLKVVPAQRAGEPAARMGLEREAQTLAGLDHPNVVRLRETVPGQGPPALVFEDVDGAPLRQVYGTLSGPQAVTVALGVLAGLGVVHARGLVHRDVSPDTVWLGGDGRVVLAGFELACAGVEHPVAPEVGVYASPEQRAQQMIDARSDLYGVAALLRDQLREPPPPPVAAVLGRALSEDPALRPASAEEFAAELRQAAYDGYGADWVGRGALAGAVAANAAVAAGVVGYGLGGAGAVAGSSLGAGGAGGVGGGAAAGAAGLGAAPPAGIAGLGAAGPAAVPAVPAAMPGASGLAPAGVPAAMPAAMPAAGAPVVGAPAAGGVTAGGGAATGGGATAGGVTAGSSGKAGALVNAGLAVAVGAVIGVVAVIVDPQPAEAQALVITPEQARVIFVRTVDEGVADDFTHYAEDAQDGLEFMLEVDDSVVDGQLVEIVVGVPPEQYDFPAWFVASAQLPHDEGTISMFARFERESADEPWLMVTLDWSTSRRLPEPVLDGDWLAPAPAVGDLLVDPESLPGRYRDWLVRADETREPGEDEVLELRFDGSGMVRLLGSAAQLFGGDDLDRVSAEHTISLGEIRTNLVPLADGTVHVVFTAVVHRILYNRPDLRPGSCDDFYLFFNPPEPPGEFRTLERDMVVVVDAWIPIATGEPAPGGEPEEDPGGEPDEDDSPELVVEPVDPTVVLIEDWRWNSENHEGIPC